MTLKAMLTKSSLPNSLVSFLKTTTSPICILAVQQRGKSCDLSSCIFLYLREEQLLDRSLMLMMPCKTKKGYHPFPSAVSFLLFQVHASVLDGLDLEMQGDQAEDQCLEVLHQVVEDTQALRVGRLGDVDKGPNLGGLEIDMLAANLDLELLSAILILLWPLAVVFPVYRSVARDIQ